MVAAGEVLAVIVFADGGLLGEVVSAGAGGGVLTAVNTGGVSAVCTGTAAGAAPVFAAAVDDGGAIVL